MKTKLQGLFLTAALCATLGARSESISWSGIGAKAGADYQDGGLAVSPIPLGSGTATGARLRCVFQRLEGEATGEGLWLTSTLTNAMKDRFQVKAVAVGRMPKVAQPSRLRANGASWPGSASGDETLPKLAGADAGATSEGMLPATGDVSVDGQSVRFIRSGLVEEYSVSMEGVRQDFVVLERPAARRRFGVPASAGSESSWAPGDRLKPGLQTQVPREGALRVELSVTGARVEQTAPGVQLVLDHSGRKIAYSRLRVTDANGKELSARMEVQETSAFSLQPSAFHLALVVNDADAVYPVRIDPTFSDANWVSISPGIPGTDSTVYAAVVDGSGNLYIGGGFAVVGNTNANHIAKWNGSSWSALGSGMNNEVRALAVDGSGNLYAGGDFTTAGGSPANYVAKWNGSGWSALGSGISAPAGDPYYGGSVSALAVDGSGNLYAGGYFTTAGGSTANNIAQWNGSSWSALGSGMNGHVWALAVDGSGNLYAGGSFTNAGGSAANHIAKWNGSSWSALGSGVNTDTVFPARVSALAVDGSGNVYAGGDFTTAAGSPRSRIAKWNGSSWSALGSGMDLWVGALAVDGSGNVYAGGGFTTAGRSAANYLAKSNGSSWSALGSGMNNWVFALAVDGSGNLYAGGVFTTAGGDAANYIAQWNGSSWSALGSGMNGYVNALAVDGSGNLYAGGYFTTAGGKVSGYAARAVLGDAPGYNQITSQLLPGGEMQLSFVGYPATNYALDRAFSLSPPVGWVPQGTNSMSVSGVLLFTNSPVVATNNFWRVRTVP